MIILVQIEAGHRIGPVVGLGDRSLHLLLMLRQRSGLGPLIAGQVVGPIMSSAIDMIGLAVSPVFGRAEQPADSHL